MTDLVVTVPQGFWDEWLAEGDCAGTPETGTEYVWHTGRRAGRDKDVKQPINRGDRLYIVAKGLLRGYAVVTDIWRREGKWVIFRKGGAVACTIDRPISGFQGWRKRSWEISEERPFPEWKTAVGPKGPPRRRAGKHA